MDGITCEAPERKVAAVHALKGRGYRPLPLRRVYIPKSNGKLRPLGIPTMKDRAMQASYLLPLDPTGGDYRGRKFIGVPQTALLRRCDRRLLCSPQTSQSALGRYPRLLRQH